MTTTNISDLWRERQAAIAEFEVNDDEAPPSRGPPGCATSLRMKRSRGAAHHYRGARGTDGLLEAAIQTGHCEDAELAASIAEQLEKLAPVAGQWNGGTHDLHRR